MLGVSDSLRVINLGPMDLHGGKQDLNCINRSAEIHYAFRNSRWYQNFTGICRGEWKKKPRRRKLESGLHGNQYIETCCFSVRLFFLYQFDVIVFSNVSETYMPFWESPYILKWYPQAISKLHGTSRKLYHCCLHITIKYNNDFQKLLPWQQLFKIDCAFS